MSQKFELFGKYILLEKISQGGMAEIYLAKSSENHNFGKFFAVKRILPKYSQDAEFISMFKSEAKVSLNLSHGNIVSIYEFGVIGEHFYLVMNYVTGKNLSQIRKKLKKSGKTLSVPQIMFLIKNVALGLDHAHKSLDSSTGKSLNIIHRDISPQNIMVSFDAQPQIIDFGIAKNAEQTEHTVAGALKGKFSYMSPEQVTRKPISLTTDIFSLGIVFWEMLADRKLFDGQNEIDILNKIKECNIPSLRNINPEVPPELEEIIMTALAKEPYKRYQFASDFYEKTNQLLNKLFSNFSQQHFSAMLKSVYADEILEIRKKQIEYSNVRVNKKSKVSNKKNMNTVTHFPDLPGTSIDTEVENSSIGKIYALEKNLKLEDKPTRISLERKAQEMPIVHTNPISFEKSYSRFKPAPFNNETFAKNQKKRVILKYAAIIATVSAIFFSYGSLKTLANLVHMKISKNFDNNLLKGISSSKIDLNPKLYLEIEKQNAKNIKLSQKNKYTKVSFHVTSDPSGAKIFINGKDINKSTPSLVKVPLDKPFNLKLAKENYLSYEKKIDSKFLRSNKKTLSVITLQEVEIAYIDISAKSPINPLVAIIFINGKELYGEKLPLKDYPIIAEKENLIEIIDPVNSLSASRKVKLQPGTKNKIMIVLKKTNQRLPSGLSQ